MVQRRFVIGIDGGLAERFAGRDTAGGEADVVETGVVVCD